MGLGWRVGKRLPGAEGPPEEKKQNIERRVRGRWGRVRKEDNRKEKKTEKKTNHSPGR